MNYADNLIYAFSILKPTWFVLALVAILIDLLTGFVIKGLIPHNVQSSIMREGLVHKSWEIAILMCAAMTDIAISAGIGIDMQPLSKATCAYIFIMEMASVCENALEGNAEFVRIPIVRHIIKYVARPEQSGDAGEDPDDTAWLGKHIGGRDGR